MLLEADLTGADLTFSTLVGADLRRATLSRAVLRDVDLANVRLKGARWTSGTVWPGHAAPEIVKMSTETAPGIFQIDFPSKGEIPALSPAAG
jgi:hypothetical protein